MIRGNRITCCVPHCARTTKNDEHTKEWICSVHWAQIPKYRRRRDSKLLRLYIKRFGKTAFWEFPAGSKKRIEAARLARLLDKSWAIIRKQAIERAMGI
jgi:hypothetical protein